MRQLVGWGGVYKMPNQLVSWLAFIQRVIWLKEMPMISTLASPACAALTSSQPHFETRQRYLWVSPTWGLGICMKQWGNTMLQVFGQVPGRWPSPTGEGEPGGFRVATHNRSSLNHEEGMGPKAEWVLGINAQTTNFLLLGKPIWWLNFF